MRDGLDSSIIRRSRPLGIDSRQARPLGREMGLPSGIWLWQGHNCAEGQGQFQILSQGKYFLWGVSYPKLPGQFHSPALIRKMGLRIKFCGHLVYDVFLSVQVTNVYYFLENLC